MMVRGSGHTNLCPWGPKTASNTSLYLDCRVLSDDNYTLAKSLYLQWKRTSPRKQQKKTKINLFDADSDDDAVTEDRPTHTSF